MIRLFAAIALPEEIGRPLQGRQLGLPGARWRPLEALHITLRFFGDLPEDRADDLDAELSTVTGEAFDLSLAGVGHFGEGVDIHAVWAGVEDSVPLRQLQKRCEAAARRAGMAAETRAYLPHVTLAYLKRPAAPDVAAWEQEHNLLRSPPFRVDRFSLYSSHQTRTASVYRLERSYPLQTAPA